MSLRSSLIQIIALLVGLIIASFVALPGLPEALAEVRLPLVLVLGVALGYLQFFYLPQQVRVKHVEVERREQERTR